MEEFISSPQLRDLRFWSKKVKKYIIKVKRQPAAYEMSTPTTRRRLTDADRLVNRLRNTMPERFNTLVKMHLSFSLELDGTKLEDMFSENGTEKQEHAPKRKASTPFSKKKEKHNSALFGASLSDDNVARIYQLIEYLARPENLRTEGLFRKTGNVARQRLLKEWLNEGVELCLDEATFTPHDCATVLKNYLGELPEPLLTEKHYEAHLQVAEMAKNVVLEKEKLRVKSKQLKTLQLLFLLLPHNNALLFECLIDLLHRVARVSENMMTAQSLGTVFAPHLLCPTKISPEDLQAISPVITQAVSFMIENGSQIFKIPKELIADIANYWREMETPGKCSKSRSVEDQENSTNLHSAKKYGSTQAVNTVIKFAERTSLSDSDNTNDTQVALAQLYAHVQRMPESSKKKKLLKQFNSASGNTQHKKHSRSRTLGEQIKKHFSSLHRHHKRRGSNDPSHCTAGLSWGVTNAINIDENDNVKNDDVFIAKTPERTQSLKITKPCSPAVHIVDLSKSPATPRARKRISSGSSDGSIPDKRPTPDKLPCSENEIRYISGVPLERVSCQHTPKSHQGKPVALVSPITQSVRKVPHKMQKAIYTPRSRAPMLIQKSPQILMRESLL